MERYVREREVEERGQISRSLFCVDLIDGKAILAPKLKRIAVKHVSWPTPMQTWYLTGGHHAQSVHVAFSCMMASLRSTCSSRNRTAMRRDLRYRNHGE